MLSSRLNAFVIPISQTTPSTVAAMSLRDDLDADAGGEHERRGRDLRRELRERREAVDVVEQPGDEEDRAAAEDAAELAARRDRARAASATPTATSRPAMIPLPPSSGVERLCQRSARGAATTMRAAGVRSSAQIVSRLAGSAASAAAATVTAQRASAARFVRLVPRRSA